MTHIFDTFEPFDTEFGFLIGQSFMLIFMVYVGWSSSFKQLLIGLIGLYLSQNMYAYIFGTSEQKAWALLLLITSLALCIIPLVSGLIARFIKISYAAYTKHS